MNKITIILITTLIVFFGVLALSAFLFIFGICISFIINTFGEFIAGEKSGILKMVLLIVVFGALFIHELS